MDPTDIYDPPDFLSSASSASMRLTFVVFIEMSLQQFIPQSELYFWC